MRHIEPPPREAIEAALVLGGKLAAQRIFRAHINKQRDLSPDEKKEWVRGSLRKAMGRYVQEGLRQTMKGHAGAILTEPEHRRIVEEFERWLGKRF